MGVLMDKESILIRLSSIENCLRELRERIAMEGVCECSDPYSHKKDCYVYQEQRDFYWGTGERGSEIG